MGERTIRCSSRLAPDRRRAHTVAAGGARQTPSSGSAWMACSASTPTRLLLTVDYPDQRLSLAAGALPAPDGREVLTRGAGRAVHRHTELMLGGVKEIGVIDTQGGIGFPAMTEVASRLAFARRCRWWAVRWSGAARRFRYAGACSRETACWDATDPAAAVAVHPLPPDIPSQRDDRAPASCGISRSTIGPALRCAVRLTRADTTALHR